MNEHLQSRAAPHECSEKCALLCQWLHGFNVHLFPSNHSSCFRVALSPSLTCSALSTCLLVSLQNPTMCTVESHQHFLRFENGSKRIVLPFENYNQPTKYHAWIFANVFHDGFCEIVYECQFGADNRFAKYAGMMVSISWNLEPSSPASLAVCSRLGVTATRPNW